MKSILALSVIAAALFAASSSIAQSLTPDEIGALQKKVQDCWTLPAAATLGEIVPVQLIVRLDGDGALTAEPELIGGKLLMTGGNSPYKDLALSAQKALVDCAPYRLPPQKYPAWREMRMLFNTRGAAPCFMCSSCHGVEQGVCGHTQGRVDITFNLNLARREGF
jgi:hypothetical protein